MLNSSEMVRASAGHVLQKIQEQEMDSSILESLVVQKKINN